MTKKNESVIRIGIVGAGENTRLQHIPRLKSIQGVEIISVANRTRLSAKRVADSFSIPEIYDDWRDLVHAKNTDAIVIGTWPNLHCEVTLAAFKAGKHVLCEARMAMNAAEAHRMLTESKKFPHLVAQLVPAPYTLSVDKRIKDLITSGMMGPLYSIELSASLGKFADVHSPLHWRQDTTISGLNIMTLGIWYESIIRWVGPANKVMAMGKVFVRERLDPATKSPRAVEIPDHLSVLAEMECGALANLRLSAVTGGDPHPAIWIYGRDGTLHYEISTNSIRWIKRGESNFRALTVDSEKDGVWRVEEEFIGAIRRQERVRLTTFEDGAQYMEFTEAVHRSMKTGQSITLSLT